MRGRLSVGFSIDAAKELRARDLANLAHLTLYPRERPSSRRSLPFQGASSGGMPCGSSSSGRGGGGGGLRRGATSCGCCCWCDRLDYFRPSSHPQNVSVAVHDCWWCFSLSFPWVGCCLRCLSFGCRSRVVRRLLCERAGTSLLASSAGTQREVDGFWRRA